MASSLQSYLKRYTSSSIDESKPKKKKKTKSSAHNTGSGGIRIIDDSAVWQSEIKDESAGEEDEDDAPQVVKDVEVKRMQKMEALKVHRPYLSMGDDGSGWVTLSESCSPSKVSKPSGQKDSMNHSPLRNSHRDSPDLSPLRKSEHAYNISDFSPPRNARHNTPDLSPSRKSRHLTLGVSPPWKSRTDNVDLSPSRKKRHDTPDLSPPMKNLHSIPDLSPSRKKRHDTPDFSPPGKKHLGTPDLSPPRKNQHVTMDLSPPRKRYHDSPDLPPPRKTLHGNRELSLPSSLPRKNSYDRSKSSPTWKNRHDTPDLSPLRKSHRDTSTSIPSKKSRHGISYSSLLRKGRLDMDYGRDANIQVLERERRHERPKLAAKDGSLNWNPSLSPPQRKLKSQHDYRSLSSPAAEKSSESPSPEQVSSHKNSTVDAGYVRQASSDLSPPRKGQPALGSIDKDMRVFKVPEKRRDRKPLSDGNPRDSDKMTDGTAAGLQSASEMVEEIQRKKKENARRFAAMDPSASGRGAEVVYRDKRGRRLESLDELIKLQQVDKKPEEKVLEWGKGLAQQKEMEARQAELEEEKYKPFARSRDDPELDNLLKERIRWGDPMAHLVKKKSSELILEDLGEREQMKESGFIIPQNIPSHSWLKRGISAPANRYGIKPGRHWDGVDRSTGFERDMFKRQNEKKATELEAYLWSVSEM